MKFLLTSGGTKNTSISNALIDLLGKPIAECSALCIPTAAYGHPMAGPGAAWRFISGQANDSMCESGMVGFSIFPHLDHEKLPDNSMADAERWAAGMAVAAYAIDDQTTIKVVDGEVEVVSEGHWKRFTPY